jgi:hypothetical protein
LKTFTCLEENKNLLRDLERTEAIIDCAGEGQQQLNLPTDRLTERPTDSPNDTRVLIVSHMEAGSNTSTIDLRVVGGDGKRTWWLGV